jgi:hypothetical protein
MPSTPTPNLRLEIQASGENDSTWGDIANNVFQLLEDAITKRQPLTVTGGDVTLTATNFASDQARSLCLALTGVLSSNANVIIPAVSKFYLVTNGCTGSYTVTVKTASGTGIVVEQGSTAIVYCDGTNVIGVAPSGAILGYARLDTAQSFTKGQATTVVTLTDATNIAVDADASNKFRVVLGGNRTLSNPTNARNGAIIEILVVQDGPGSRTLAYGSKFVWPSGTAPTLTTTANRADLLTFSYDAPSDKWLGSYILNYAI